MYPHVQLHMGIPTLDLSDPSFYMFSVFYILYVHLVLAEREIMCACVCVCVCVCVCQCLTLSPGRRYRVETDFLCAVDL